MAVQEKAEWRAHDLAERVGIPPALLRRRALFWVNQARPIRAPAVLARPM